MPNDSPDATVVDKQAAACKAQSSAPAGGAQQPCPQAPVAKIVKIDWLDDTDDSDKAKKLIASKGTQYVNLARETKWVDGTLVKNKDRLTHKPRFRVEFDQPGSHSFKVKLVPGGSNAPYTATEKARNANFKYTESEASYTTDADGTKLVDGDMNLTVAGDDSYKLEAKDDQGNKVTSSELVTRRLMYCVEIKMKDLTSVASSIDTFTAEFEKHFIHFEKLAAVEMDHIHNIGTDTGPFETAARTAYAASTAPAKEPHVVAIAFTDHLAVKNPSQSVIKSGVAVGPGKPAVEIPIAGPGLTNPATKDRSLWRDLVPGEGWFVSATFTPTGGTAVEIPEAKCTPVGTGSDSTSVSVDVTGLAEATGSITLVVNWVDRMRGGLSLGDGNAVCICTRSWWQNKSTTAQNEVLVHEVGHQVGMVANATGILPDKTPSHYDSSKGHVGDHCHKGVPDGQARYDADADLTASTCVMYGATNGKSAFCADCTPAMRKLDILAGRSAF